MLIGKKALFSLRNSNIFINLYSVVKKMNVNVYLVGGGLRDLTEHSRWSDIDFAVENYCEEIAREFAHKSNGTFFSLGAEHKCYRVVVNEKDKIVELDFTPFRGVTIDDDLKKRDFTINAMALSIAALFEEKAPEIIDLFCGVSDFKQGVLRLISDDAIDEDPLRMLRGFRLAAAFSLTIDDKLLNLFGDKRALLKQVSPERIRTELFKTLASDSSTPYIKQMLYVNLLQQIVPEIDSWTCQDEKDDLQLDLLTHSLKTLEYVESILQEEYSLFTAFAAEINDHLSQQLEYGINRRSMLKFAAFLHDSGKPCSLRTEGSKLSFYGHDEEGAKINSDIAKRLKVGKSGRRVLSNITKHHMRVLHLSKVDSITKRAMDRFVRDCGDETLEILLLALADTWATRDERKLEYTDVERTIERLLERYFESKGEEVPQFLTGRDVMDLLGIEEGTEVGKYLDQLREEELAGRVDSREDAEKF
ncbi:MAG: HD domain-containing protein, partial [Proteobacteria bacterium]|nr:HD domain-containing protein [Pseudomonadota bacterium]